MQVENLQKTGMQVCRCSKYSGNWCGRKCACNRGKISPQVFRRANVLTLGVRVCVQLVR